MDKSKLFFGIVAGLVALVCVIAFLLPRDPAVPHRPDNSATTQPTEPKDPSGSDEQVDPSYQEQSTNVPTRPKPAPGGAGDRINGYLPDVDYIETINLDNSVTIKRVATDPNEVIDHYPLVEPDHEEYISGNDAGACVGTEGKVYRNDRIISIDITDRFTGDVYTITFGYPTGKCNRFLYLNPIVAVNGKSSYELKENFYFQFPYISIGSVANFGGYQEEFFSEWVSFNMKRHRAEYRIANFRDYQAPGSVWFTQPPANEPVKIQTRVFTDEGYELACIELIVEKDENGTYGFTNIRNMDLWEDNSEYPNFTHEELEYIASIVNEAVHDSTFVVGGGMFRYQNRIIEANACHFDMREMIEGYYYPRFINVNVNATDICREVCSDIRHTIAVTVNYGDTTDCSTFYLWVLGFPGADGRHGIYQPVGSDYDEFGNAEEARDHSMQW